VAILKDVCEHEARAIVIQPSSSSISPIQEGLQEKLSGGANKKAFCCYFLLFSNRTLLELASYTQPILSSQI
jgi:hypothetical protein